MLKYIKYITYQIKKKSKNTVIQKQKKNRLEGRKKKLHNFHLPPSPQSNHVISFILYR